MTTEPSNEVAEAIIKNILGHLEEIYNNDVSDCSEEWEEAFAHAENELRSLLQPPDELAGMRTFVEDWKQSGDNYLKEHDILPEGYAEIQEAACQALAGATARVNVLKIRLIEAEKAEEVPDGNP